MLEYIGIQASGGLKECRQQIMDILGTGTLREGTH